MLKKIFTGIVGCLLAVNAQAMAIDKMLLVVKEKSGFFEVTNNTSNPLFISAQITEKDVSAKAIVETPYTAKNVEQWKINLYPAKFVLAPEESKIIYVNENDCAQNKVCDRKKDAVFAVTFMPHIYVPEGSQQASDVGILFGFEPTVVLPAQKQNVTYRQRVEGNTLVVTNTGNTLISVMANQCRQLPPGAKQNDCMVYRHVHTGRTARIELPQPYRKNNLDIKVLNGFETYKKDYVL